MKLPSSRRMRALSLPLSLSVALAACSDDPAPKAALGEACAIDGDCVSGLVCRAQACTMPGNTNPDMNPDADTTPDQPSVQPEDYIISFERFSSFGDDQNTYLHVLNTATDAVTVVNDDPNACASGCWLSRDSATFIYLRPNPDTPGTDDVYAAAVGDDYKVVDQGSVIISAISRLMINGDLLSFSRQLPTGELRVSAQRLGSQQEILIGDLPSSAQTQGTWAADGDSEQAALMRPTLQSLNVTIGQLGSPITGDPTFTLDASNYQAVGGSYFGSNIPAAFSADGRYMAMSTSAPNDYGLCQADTDCSGTGQRCGVSGRCTAYENTIHFFDLENLDVLGTQCNSDAQCGSVHQCYIAAPTQLDTAFCIPRRVVLGLPKSPPQRAPGGGERGGCENTAGEPLRGFTSLSGEMNFAADGSLYVVGRRECAGVTGEPNIPTSSILRLSPTGGAPEVVFGNASEDFSDAKCYDLNERRVDITSCIVYISTALLSPGGNELAFLATNPNTQEPARAVDALDVWTILRDGTRKAWNGGGDLFDRVKSIGVHQLR